MNRWEKWAELPHHHVVKLHRGISRRGMHYLHALCFDDLSEIPKKSLDLPFLKPKEEFGASSCGGLLFFDFHGTKFCVMNPTTNKWRFFFHNIDKPLEVTTGALGYDNKSDIYKMVRICYHLKNGLELTADVYSFKKQVWEKIKPPPRLPFDCSVYVAATGKSYWPVGNSVLSFDFSNNSFDCFHFPPLPYLYCAVYRVLVKLHDGLLGVVCYWSRGSNASLDEEYPGHYYELWAWRETEEEWYKIFDPVCLCGGAVDPIGLIDGRLLLLKGTTYSDNSIMLAYDWTTKKCIDPKPCLRIYDRVDIPVLSYVETTYELPPPQGQEEEEEEEEEEEQQEEEVEEEEMEECLGPINILGLTEDTRGDDGKEYLYEEIIDEYRDWLTNGFRVVDKYHPSQDKYVYEFDCKTYMGAVLRRLTDGPPPDDCTPYVYTTQLKKKMTIDERTATEREHPPATEREQPIEHDNKRQKIDALPPSLSRGYVDKKDQTTVYAYGIPTGIIEDDVSEFFKKFGKVNVESITDQKSRVWSIKFDDCGSVPMARALSGRPCFGQALVVLNDLVNYAQDLPRTETSTQTISLSTRIIRVEQLPLTFLDDDHLYEIFSRFGIIRNVSLRKGFAYVEFFEVESAKKALQFDGILQIRDKCIKVSLAEYIPPVDVHMADKNTEVSLAEYIPPVDVQMADKNIEVSFVEDRLTI